MSTPKTESARVDPVATTADGGEGLPQVDSAVQGAIGRKLREAYDEVVKEQVPDRFLQLLGELKKTEQDPTKGGA